MIALPEEAIEILKELKSESKSGWIFSGQKKDKRYQV